ncbi:MAG: ribosome maturation factor RimP [Candidatus Bipolaricaulota bacterium]|nr:ribosome maturation factor RimP [Candidatus Bipolaricaulota bacterium]MDW8126527.1 ribosome maturation factor RimP [Candidatus Bipolaricaulota bacterium]
MKVPREKLEEIIRQGAALAQVELYHWEFGQHGRELRLTVYIDRPGGVSVEDCARASEVISGLLDTADPIPSPYVLEVSSPGLERRLWEPWHYERVVGKKIHVKVRGMEKTSYEGRLVRLSEGKAVVEWVGGRVEIPLAQVIQAWVVYEGE